MDGNKQFLNKYYLLFKKSKLLLYYLKKLIKIYKLDLK